MFKRIMSIILSAATVVGFIPHIPAKAEEIELYPYTLFAGSNEEDAISINSDNICINGNIATNGTIKTSTQSFNINGSITENAHKEIKVFFNKIDSKYFSSYVDTYFEDYFLEASNINVNIPIEAEGDISLIGNINITSGLKALNDIKLTGNVKNTQNSAICAKTGDIVIDTDNVNLNGLVYAPNGCVDITAKNLNINSVIIIADKISITCPNLNANYDTQLAGFIGNDPEIDVDLEVAALADYIENDNSLKIYWNTTVPKGNFDIKISDDNVNYQSIGTVTDTSTFTYSIQETFAKKYIKVIETTYYGETYETVPFTVVRDKDSYAVHVLDSDDDKLPDIYELKIGTDPYNADTDNDGLNDYQEYIFTQTDPLVYDSVTEGTSDSDIDTDDDGLSNIDEISRGTYPWSPDSDEDGLTDYDEIKVYFTDSLNADSDGDELDDGSEVKLGLDPNNKTTMGIPDDEYVVSQSINTDNKLLSSINTSDSPYELSIEINTNRDVEKELTVIKSGYSAVIENDAMLGASVDISISDTCNPERIVVKYTIKEPYIANSDGTFSELREFQDIRRLNIFKFNTETNMLLPIDTQFDENNDMLYTEVNELGTYCIMDMEIWLKNLGVEYKSAKDKTSYSLLNSRNVKLMAYEPPTPEKKSFNGSQYAVYDMTGMTWEEANAYCNDLGGHLVTITTYDEQRFINNNLLKNCQNNLYWIGGRIVNDSWQWVTGEKFSYTNWKIDEPTDTQNENYIHMYGKSPETYISIGQWNNTLNYYAPTDPYYYATSNCGFICEWDDKLSPNTKYEILLPTKWKTIYLDGEISPNNGIDTDKDTLTDWEEVDTTRLVWNEDGSFDIPVFDLSEIVNHIKRFKADEYKYLFEECMSNRKRHYLPIISDPSSKDSDNDGINDYDETYGVTYHHPDVDIDDVVYDGDPLNKGLADGIVGKLTVISHDPKGIGPKSIGHAFLLYESFVNDDLDFSKFAAGFKYHELDGCTIDADNWKPMPTGNYKISPNRYVCIGNFAFDGIAGGDNSAGSGSGSSSDNSSSGECATAGIHFNLELNLIYDDNNNDGSRDRGYSENAALDQIITNEQLSKIIDYWNDDQFYNLLHNNCAEIATKTWNKVSDYELDGFDFMYSPRQLKKSIKKNNDSYSIDWSEDNWKSTLNKEVIDW